MVEHYKDLGWANSWGSYSELKDGKWVTITPTRPKEIIECERLGHKHRWVSGRNCVSTVYCDDCGIVYRVDSSD